MPSVLASCLSCGDRDCEDGGIKNLLFGSGTVLAVDMRYRSPPMLAFGSMSAVLGFVVVTVIGYIDFTYLKKNRTLDIPYASGNGYWPSTVSEMVHNSETPGGKLFHTFGLIAGACIFFSQYPLALKNVYTGSETILGTNIYWTTFRQICPSMGLWLLIGVNTYPTQVALQSTGLTKLFCVFMHLIGSGMMFVGYMLCEIKCLGLLGFKEEYDGLSIEKAERRIRVFLAYVILVGFVAFCAMQVLLNIAKELDVCCEDKWVLKGDIVRDKDGEKHRIGRHPEIVDTASGTFLTIKVLSFIFEDIAGLALVFSHLAIWYFCEERHVHYGRQKLKSVFKQEEE